MPNNIDIFDKLTEELTPDQHVTASGKTLHTAYAHGVGKLAGQYLYRSMSLDEAKNWFNVNWLPGESGIPWSTDPTYSRGYLDIGVKANPKICVQLEVPIADLLEKAQAMGIGPKYETGQTWGVGPKNENSSNPSGDANKKLKDTFTAIKASLPADVAGIAAGKVNTGGNRKLVATAIFRKLFKDLVPKARVVARYYL